MAPLFHRFGAACPRHLKDARAKGTAVPMAPPGCTALTRPEDRGNRPIRPYAEERLLRRIAIPRREMPTRIAPYAAGSGAGEISLS